MSVLAHAEENQIQDRLTIGVELRDPANLRLGFGSGNIPRFLALNAMDLFLGNLQGREQKLTGHLEVAFGITWRHATFVGPEEVYGIERQFVGGCMLRGCRKKSSCDASTGQGYALLRFVAPGCFNFIAPRGRDCFCEFAVVGKANQFKMLHGSLQ
jgi:hypothetical protein